MSFDEVWEYADRIPGSFTRQNCLALYEAALRVTGTYVEVGVDQGRSASVLLHAARITGASVYLVDSWESVLLDNRDKVHAMCFDVLGNADTYQSFVVSVNVLHATSVEAARDFQGTINLLHIDANHYAPNPENDCMAWLPNLVSGGLACFHDVGCTFPAVDEAVKKYCSSFEHLGTFDCLGIWRKP